MNPESNRKPVDILTVPTMGDSSFQLKAYRCKSFVEVNGVEPMTPCLQSRCSSQLSYTPKFLRGELSAPCDAQKATEPISPYESEHSRRTTEAEPLSLHPY